MLFVIACYLLLHGVIYLLHDIGYSLHGTGYMIALHAIGFCMTLIRDDYSLHFQKIVFQCCI